MIVSIDTIKCSRQIVVVVGTCEILLSIFLKRRLLLFKKHFETDMLMLPKKISLYFVILQ